MIILAYLRDGRVHASKDAYEGGDGVASYSTIQHLDGRIEIAARIEGRDYVSAWCWPADTIKPYGAVPLVRVEPPCGT